MIERFITIEEGQMCRLGYNEWFVARLITLAKDLKSFDLPLKHLNVYNKYEHLTLREMVSHMRCVNDADMSYPIILDEDGEIMDGRHRIMHALLNNMKSIKAVRFDKNPEPCRVRSDK